MFEAGSGEVSDWQVLGFLLAMLTVSGEPCQFTRKGSWKNTLTLDEVKFAYQLHIEMRPHDNSAEQREFESKHADAMASLYTSNDY